MSPARRRGLIQEPKPLGDKWAELALRALAAILLDIAVSSNAPEVNKKEKPGAQTPSPSEIPPTGDFHALPETQ